MNFDAINNKIISIDTIIKIAEYLEGEKSIMANYMHIMRN